MGRIGAREAFEEVSRRMWTLELGSLMVIGEFSCRRSADGVTESSLMYNRDCWSLSPDALAKVVFGPRMREPVEASVTAMAAPSPSAEQSVKRDPSIVTEVEEAVQLRTPPLTDDV